MINRGQGGIEQAFLDYNKALYLHNHKVYAVINKRAKMKQYNSGGTKILRTY